MYVIDRNGELIGPFATYQDAAIACGGCTQIPMTMNGLGAPWGTIREVRSPNRTQDEAMNQQQPPPSVQPNLIYALLRRFTQC